jgi:hypothetical protein
MERDHSEDLGVDVNIIRMNHREIVWEYMDWIHLAQDRDQRRVLVKTVMNLLDLRKEGDFLTI